MEVILFEKGTQSQFDLRPQHFRLPRTYLFRDSPSKKGKILAYTRLKKANDKVTSNRIMTQTQGENRCIGYDYEQHSRKIIRLQSMLRPILLLFKNMPTTTQPAIEQ